MRAIRRTDWRDPRACATRVTYQSGRIHIYAAAGERLPLIRMKRKWRRANLVIFAISSWPFGPALSVFRCGRYFGAVSVWVPSVYRWGWYLRSHRDCCSPACIWLRKTLSIPKHQAYQNIDYTKTSNVPKRQPHQSIDHAKAWTTPKNHVNLVTGTQNQPFVQDTYNWHSGPPCVHDTYNWPKGQARFPWHL